MEQHKLSLSKVVQAVNSVWAVRPPPPPVSLVPVDMGHLASAPTQTWASQVWNFFFDFWHTRKSRYNYRSWCVWGERVRAIFSHKKREFEQHIWGDWVKRKKRSNKYRVWNWNIFEAQGVLCAVGDGVLNCCGTFTFFSVVSKVGALVRARYVWTSKLWCRRGLILISIRSAPLSAETV